MLSSIFRRKAMGAPPDILGQAERYLAADGFIDPVDKQGVGMRVFTRKDEFGHVTEKASIYLKMLGCPDNLDGQLLIFTARDGNPKELTTVKDYVREKKLAEIPNPVKRFFISFVV